MLLKNDQSKFVKTLLLVAGLLAIVLIAILFSRNFSPVQEFPGEVRTETEFATVYEREVPDQLRFEGSGSMFSPYMFDPVSVTNSFRTDQKDGNKQNVIEYASEQNVEELTGNFENFFATNNMNYSVKKNEAITFIAARDPKNNIMVNIKPGQSEFTKVTVSIYEK